MRMRQRKLTLLQDICRMYLELGELCSTARNDELALGRMLQGRRITRFRYDVEMEASRRQYKRIAGLLERLDQHYESVRRLPDEAVV